MTDRSKQVEKILKRKGIKSWVKQVDSLENSDFVLIENKKCTDNSELITTEEYKDMLVRGETYPPGHPSGIPSGFNKKVLGMFKEEVNGIVIDEFVGLRARLYPYKMYEDEENKKCLTDRKPQLRKMNVIRFYGHVVYTDDDERHILEDGINTLALGHYRIL